MSDPVLLNGRYREPINLGLSLNLAIARGG